MIILRLDDAIIKSLTNNELNILKYVYAHTDDILNMSIHELAKQVSYSSATILRFCKKLGYSGYAEFKYELYKETKRSKSDVRAPKESAFSIQMIMNSLSSNVEGTAKLIQADQLYQTFRYFDSDCPLYLWAPGGLTSILAGYFEKLLFSIGRPNVYKIDASRMGEHILQNIHNEAVLILISTTGNYAPTVKLAKLAQMNNVPTISITPYANNEIAKFATVNFRFFTNLRENMGAEFTSRLPVFYVIHMIIRCYLQYKREGEADFSMAAPENMEERI